MKAFGVLAVFFLAVALGMVIARFDTGPVHIKIEPVKTKPVREYYTAGPLRGIG